MKAFPHVFRRKYYLPGTIQSQLLLRIMGVFVVVILISATIFYFLSEQDVSGEYYKAHQTLSNTKEILLPLTVGVNLVAIVLACLFVIFPSHKIAGPVFHIQRDLKKIREGIFPARISVRKNDILKEFAEDLDSTMKVIKEHIGSIQNNLHELDSYVSSRLSSGTVSDKELQEIHEKVKLVVSEISFFKINENNNSIKQ